MSETDTKEFLAGKPADEGQLILERRFRLLLSATHANHFERALDVGCGNAAQTVFLVPYVVDLHALDLLQENLDIALARMPSATLHQGVAEKLPFKDSSFDLVTSFETIEHVTDDAQAVREIARVVKPGGWVIISVPNKWWVFETHGATMPGALNKLPWNRTPFFSWLPKPIHERFANARIYTKRRFERLLERAGFDIIEHHYVTAPMDVLPIPALQKCLRATIFHGDTTAIPMLATSHFFACKKRS